jgi:hypothetical protein
VALAREHREVVEIDGKPVGISFGVTFDGGREYRPLSVNFDKTDYDRARGWVREYLLEHPEGATANELLVEFGIDANALAFDTLLNLMYMQGELIHAREGRKIMDTWLVTSDLSVEASAALGVAKDDAIQMEREVPIWRLSPQAWIEMMA